MPRVQVIEIEAPLIRKNFDHQSDIHVEEKILFRVESHVFAGEEFGSKWRLYKFPWLKPICFSEYLKKFLELWNALKPFGMWKHFGNPLQMVQILFEKPLWKCRGKNILLVYVHYAHAGQCATVLHVIIYIFLQKCHFAAWFGTDLLIVVERSKVSHNACETSSKFSAENFGHLRM